MTLHVCALEIELVLPGCRTLKDKRARLRPILDRVRHRFPVALAEVDRQDDHQQAVLAFAAVSGTASMVTEQLDEIERLVWAAADVEVGAAHRFWLDTER